MPSHNDTTSINRNQITQILAKSLLPLNGEYIWYEDEFTRSLNARWKAQTEFTQRALPILMVVSIHWLQYLQKQESVAANFESDSMELMLGLLCYSIDDGSYPWSISPSTPQLTKLRNALQDAVEPFCHNQQGLQSLLEHIKPAFMNHTKHPSVSSAGRKLFTAENNAKPSRTFMSSFQPENESNIQKKISWRTKHQFALCLLEVYISSANEKDLQAAWPFIVPCLLNIVDDHNPGIKRKGGDLVYKLAKSIDATFFTRTGIAPVFWSALKPTLAYLPPSTPASISIPLSRSTYNAMMALTYCSNVAPNKLHEEYFLDGILTGISHCRTYTKSMIEFINISTDLVQEHLKTYTTRHLKPLIAIITGTLCDPFVTFSPELVLAACDLAIAVIKTTWFRVIVYRYDLLRALITVSKRVIGDYPSLDNTTDQTLNPNDSSEMIAKAKSVLSLLQTAVEINITSSENIEGLVNFQNELSLLSNKEPAFAKIVK